MKQKESRRRSPGQRANISRSEVLRAAVARYRQDGVGGVSMRTVARDLGVSPNALYSYVRSKDDLLDEVMDAVLDEVEIPGEQQPWQEALETLMLRSRAVLLDNPELLPYFLSRPTRGPNARRLGEATLAILERGGITGEAAVRALRIVLVYTVGFAAQEAPRRNDPDNDSRRARSIRSLKEAGPNARVFALSEYLAQHPEEATFLAGLRWLIAGLGSQAAE